MARSSNSRPLPGGGGLVWLPRRIARLSNFNMYTRSINRFGYRVESPGCQTRAPHALKPPEFGYRAESPARRTLMRLTARETQFGYRAESPGRRTDCFGKRHKKQFGYRAESPGRRTDCFGKRHKKQFGYRAESPGRRTVANEAAGQMPNPVPKPDEKTQVFLLHRPRTGSFPVRCGSPQASIPAPTAVRKAIPPYSRLTRLTRSSDRLHFSPRGAAR